jgi:type III restriction enzyme
MFDFQVDTPILNGPYDEPSRHWHIAPGEDSTVVETRRKASYYWRGAKRTTEDEDNEDIGLEIELLTVNRIRERVQQWRSEGCQGASRITLELLAWWQREGRAQRLFFAQLEAATTVIFLTEARADYLQGITVPLDEPTARQREDGTKALRRYACKMATGSGKTTVMGMLAAWSILNKLASGGRDARFSDFVLVLCPNVTIRSRLGELDPAHGDASLYRTRDLVPPHLMSLLGQGRVVVNNWHAFELLDDSSVAGDSAKVVRRGRELRTRQVVKIADKTTTSRGARYMTLQAYRKLVTLDLLEVISEQRDGNGTLVQADVIETRHVESDTKWLRRVLGDGARKRNLLVLNDEAHHAYRLADDAEAEEDDDGDDLDAYYREATVWVEGLDRVNRLIGVGQVLDFSATPYYLGRVGERANRPFEWVVSDFGLVEAIESGLTKIPQFAARDLSGQPIPGYFNIWRWILPQLKPAERGGRFGLAKPEAVLRHAHTPLVMLGGLWQQLAGEWAKEGAEARPPVFIIVCKNIKLAKLVYEWLAEDKPPAGVPSSGLADFLNRSGVLNTIRVDNAVSGEQDSGNSKSDEDRWMRFTLDTVGKRDWPHDTIGRPMYPQDFETLAAKLERPLHPPGRDVRAIVSVGMLTEGWDCNTVTHIVGLRPFMSQLLCEQVVGRGLRRASYEVGADGKLGEEVAQVFGVPFQVVPFKAAQQGPPRVAVKTWRVRALPERAALKLEFPRVEGYVVESRGEPHVDWAKIDPILLDPTEHLTVVEMKAGLPGRDGTPMVNAPGRLDEITLAAYRSQNRVQSQAARAARDLLRQHARRTGADPAELKLMYPKFVSLVLEFVTRKALAHPPAEKGDVFLSPYYGVMQERLLEALTVGHASALLPRYEQSRPSGSTAAVDYTTRKEPISVLRSHLNYVVADSQWERIAATALDKHPRVESFAKNSGLGFAIPYLHRGTAHDYLPDFIVKLAGSHDRLILEIKGQETEQTDAKKRAAMQWCEAVSADGQFGQWRFVQLTSRPAIVAEIDAALA